MQKNRSSHKAGLPPGTLIYVGEEKAEKATATVIRYNAENAEVITGDLGDVTPLLPKEDGTVTWVQVAGVHDLSIIEELGKTCNLHPLVLEDVAHTLQRPKVEDYVDYLFVVMRAQHPHDEQISLILGPEYVISFQEYESTLFDAVKERLLRGKGRIRKLGAGYLYYALMDTVVDSNYHVMESINERLVELQESVLEDPFAETLQGIHSLKGEVFRLRKAVWPLREMMGKMQRVDSGLISGDIAVFYRDVLDHAIQIADTVENFREMLTSIQDIHLSSMSNKLNDVMRVLTVIATIFIPLTFLAGIYGMNFKYMPELEWKGAYPAFWVMVLGLGIGMVWWFKSKKWL
ncbi:MAG: magnesium/cobalt transporter CorA [Desulfatibacillum sp.]|nr:magnesium/cobalt transporter CorA [Desulfatibacillum sp.]